jgi:hypothetical protein
MGWLKSDTIWHVFSVHKFHLVSNLTVEPELLAVFRLIIAV